MDKLSIEFCALIISIITILFLIYQTRIQTITTKNQIYQNFVNNSLEIDRALIEHPEMRDYVYGNKEVDEAKVDVNLLMSIEELLVDVVENIYVFRNSLPAKRREGWMEFARNVRQSPAYEIT